MAIPEEADPPSARSGKRAKSGELEKRVFSFKIHWQQDLRREFEVNKISSQKLAGEIG